MFPYNLINGVIVIPEVLLGGESSGNEKKSYMKVLILNHIFFKYRHRHLSLCLSPCGLFTKTDFVLSILGLYSLLLQVG